MIKRARKYRKRKADPFELENQILQKLSHLTMRSAGYHTSLESSLDAVKTEFHKRLHEWDADIETLHNLIVKLKERK